MNSNTITAEQIEAILEHSTFESHKMGAKTLVVTATLPCGFEITTSSACVDPANYDHDVGMGIAKNKIRDRVWELEGYRLQQSLTGE